MGTATVMIPFTRSSSFSSRLGDELMSLGNDDHFTDFTIISGEEKLACHKVLLAANSPVLKAMIKSNMRESKTNELHLDDIPPVVIKVLLEYMYKGEMTVPEKHLADLFEAANFLQLIELKKICLEKIIVNVRPENVIAWFKFAGKMELQDLLSQCSKMMIDSFHEVYKTKDFLALNFTELSSYLGDIKDKKSIDPDDVLSAVLLWASHDSSARSPLLDDLIQNIALQKCSLQCFKEVKEKHADVLNLNTTAYAKLFDSAVKAGMMTNVRKQRGGWKSLSQLPVILGGGMNICDMNADCWCVDSSGSVSDFCKIPAEFSRLRSSFCKTPEGFILTGGEGSVTNAMYITSKKTWKKLKQLTSKRSCHASIFLHGLLIVMGGRVNGFKSNTVEFYNVEHDTWQYGPFLPIEVEHPIVSSCADEIFLFDTEQASLYRMRHRVFWQKKTPPPHGNYTGSKMVSVNENQLCVVGGDNSVHVWYTISTDTWRVAAKPLLEHDHGAVLHINNKLILLGGHFKDDVEEYDMEAKSWSVCGWKIPKPVGRLTGLMLDAD